jgi:hypothetical protein
MRLRLGLVALAMSLLTCGRAVVPDAVIAVQVVSPTTMPFHGPSGPGTEPISITFRWTVVITASAGTTSRVAVVRTELTERHSGKVLALTTFPASDSLPGGGELQLAEATSGFFQSSLYPGDWAGVTTAQVAHASGAAETVTASFSFGRPQ